MLFVAKIALKAEVAMSLLSLIEPNISTTTVSTLENVVKELGTTISSSYLEMGNCGKHPVEKSPI
jgi:hypothetical protein